METLTPISDYEIERKKPMPSKNHARVEHRLNVLLAQFEEFDVLSELSLDLPTGDTVPDLCLYPKMDFDWENDQTRMITPPITTFEILSPTQAVQDLVQKIRNSYFPAGVQSSWLIIPPLKTVHVFYPDQSPQTYTNGLIKDQATGIEINIADIFK